jgi:hypothetical protein
MNIWYAKVDFDSALALSMGLGKARAQKALCREMILKISGGWKKTFLWPNGEKR